MNLTLVKNIINSRLLLLLVLLVFELFHLNILFGNAEYLAGGDNYIYLQLETQKMFPYYWNNLIHPFGSINFAMPDTLGMQLYSVVLGFLSGPLAQRLILYLLYLFRYVAFYKIIKYISPKVSVFALVPAVIIYALNAFSSLDPFSFFPLMNAVYLPLALYYFLKLFNSDSFDLVTLFKLSLLSVIFSPINSNIPLAVTIFIPQILYVLFSCKKLNKLKVKNVLAYYVLWVFLNLWWIFPLLKYFTTSASSVFNINWFSATGVGNTFMNLRFLGQWAWYSKHFLYYYYPFNNYFDNFIVVLVTYLVVGIALFNPFNKTSADVMKYRLYFLVLSLLSLLFVGGSRLPFGFVYRILYENLFGFKIFREPFTKFELIYVLAISVLLYFSLFNLEKTLNKRTKYFVFGGLMVLCLISIKPVLLGEHVWTKWNGNMRTFRIQIPDYWREFKNYLVENSIKGEKIITFPKVNYGTAWNWPHGFTSADDVAVNFVGPYNYVVRNPLASTGGDIGMIIDSIYNNKNPNQYFLGFLGIRYILLENDLDWRYSGRNMSPSETLSILGNMGVQKVKDFGILDAEYLKSIPNDTPFPNDKKMFYTELENKPALSLFTINQDYINPIIFSPNKIIYSTGDTYKLSEIYNREGFGNNTLFLLGQYDSFKKDFINDSLIDFSNTYVLYPKQVEPLFFPERVEWEEGWFWPEVNVSPASLEYKFVKLVEKIELLRFSKLEKLDRYIWFSSKRIEEIRKYSKDLSNKQKDSLLNDYISNINEGFEIINSYPTNDPDETYTGLLKKFIRYFERSFAYLSTTDFDISKDQRLLKLKESYNELITKVIGDNCGEYCFDFKIPKNGAYTLNVNNKEIGVGELKVEDRDYSPLNPNLFLEHIDIGEWKDFGITSKFAEIKNFQSDQQYKIKFDYKTNVPKTSVSIVEEIGADKRADAIQKKSSLDEDLHVFEINPINNESLKGTRYCVFIENESCYSHFEAIFTSKKDIKNAILVFGFETVENTIKNLEIQRVYDPIINLVGENNVNSEFQIPSITFQKLNPTRYRVLIENIKGKFLLVFNQNFDKNWKLFEQNNLFTDEVKIKEYQNFNVAEMTIKDIFFDFDYLKTFFQKPFPDNRHFVANGYANGWDIEPSLVSDKLELIIEYTPQRNFYVLMVIYVLIVTVFAGIVAVKLYRNKINK